MATSWVANEQIFLNVGQDMYSSQKIFGLLFWENSFELYSF